MVSIDVLLTRLQEQFGANAKLKLEHGQITMEIAAGDLLACCNILHKNLDFQFEQLVDLCGVDYLTFGQSEWATNTATAQGFSRGVDPRTNPDIKKPETRFAVVYHLLSVTRNQRIRLRVFAPTDMPRVPSVISIWPCADWYEREAFDLYGILFEGHPDLRRILTDYAFVGHPFRKDFPLIGEVEMRYDATEERVVYEPVSIEPRTLVPRVIRHIAHEPAGETK